MADQYTEKQIKMLAILPSITSPLSILGSAGIMYMVYLRGEKRLYHRLMLSMSVVDIITSAMGMLGPMPVPEDTGVFLAKGNTASCSAQGFFLHLTIANFMYNVCLMLTFLTIVRYGGKEETIAARYEKLMHIITIGVPLLTGGVSLFLQIFNPVASLGLLRCYISAYPPNCDSTEGVKCTRGANARTFLVLFTVAPVFIGLIIVFASIFLVWWTVHQNDRQTRRHGQYNIQNTSRAVAIQSLIYGFFFFNTYVWLMIGIIVGLATPNDASGSKFRMAVRFLGEVFYWSQGFFNFLIFLRPRYVRIHSTCKDESAWWAFREAIFGTKLEDYLSNEVGGRPGTSWAQKSSPSSGGDASNSMARSM
jgi:hypothetical protein